MTALAMPALARRDGAVMLEAGSPSVNSRKGWRPNSVKTGDKVTILINPTRNKPNDGQLDTLTFANGKKLLTPGHDFAQIFRKAPPPPPPR